MLELSSVRTTSVCTCSPFNYIIVTFNDLRSLVTFIVHTNEHKGIVYFVYIVDDKKFKLTQRVELI